MRTSVPTAIPVGRPSSPAKALRTRSSLSPVWAHTVPAHASADKCSAGSNHSPAVSVIEKCLLACFSNVLRLDIQNQGGTVMSEYVFLYRGGEAGRSPERMEQSMQKWIAWFKGLGE